MNEDNTSTMTLTEIDRIPFKGEDIKIFCTKTKNDHFHYYVQTRGAGGDFFSLESVYAFLMGRGVIPDMGRYYHFRKAHRKSKTVVLDTDNPSDENNMIGEIEHENEEKVP